MTNSTVTGTEMPVAMPVASLPQECLKGSRRDEASGQFSLVGEWGWA